MEHILTESGKNSMIRILQVVNIMDRAGIENMLMNYYRNIDREKIQFDFLTHRPGSGAYDDEIRKMGGRVFHAPRLYPWNFKMYFQFMNEFFAEHREYSIIHSHIDAMSYMPLLAAKRAGIKNRIAHSHSTGMDLDYKVLLKLFFRSQIKKVATKYCACTEDAANYLFGDSDVCIIPNAIDENRFAYNTEVRKIIRKKHKIENGFVVGHVGRFTYPKNHDFIIDMFDQLQREISEAKLLLIGDGEKKKHIETKIKKLQLRKKVIILDSINNIEKYYQAMDVFILPSRFEGLGICAIEAQISGVRTILSKRIPKEAALSQETVFLPLNTIDWVNEIKKYYSNMGDRSSLYSEYYDIEKAARRMELFYKGLLGL